MELCSYTHDEICYDGGKCPFCESIKEKDNEIEELKNQVSDLEKERDNLQSEVNSLSSEA